MKKEFGKNKIRQGEENIKRKFIIYFFISKDIVFGNKNGLL